MMNLTIRQATSLEIPSVLELARGLFPESDPQESNGDVFFIALDEDSGQAVGFAHLLAPKKSSSRRSTNQKLLARACWMR